MKATTINLRDKEDIRSKFTREAADDLFYFLMPEYIKEPNSPETTKTLQQLKRISTDGKPFSQSVLPRSMTDNIESFNRIPSDRAQDAIVYFLEEILGLEEQRSAWRNQQLEDQLTEAMSEAEQGEALGQSLGKKEQHKKVLETYPDRDDLEEVFDREYILVRDSEGLLFRLTLSHTFLKVEKKYKRPNITKTKKNLMAAGKTPDKAAAYQRFWRPIRVDYDSMSGALQLVDFPEKMIEISKSVNGYKVSVKAPNNDLVEKWEQAKDKNLEIGKQNIISLAMSLRTACYQIKFLNTDPFVTFSQSDLMKLFTILNQVFRVDGISSDLDVLGLKNLQESLIERKGQMSVPEVNSNPFLGHYIAKNTQYFSGYSPIAFKVDIQNPVFVENILTSKAVDVKDYRTELQRLNSSLKDAPMPGPKKGLSASYRSIFAFPDTKIGMEVFKLESVTETTPQTLQTPNKVVVSTSQEVTKTVEGQKFFFQLDNRQQMAEYYNRKDTQANTCYFLFTNADFADDGSDEVRIEDPSTDLPTNKMLFSGSVVYPKDENGTFEISLKSIFIGRSKISTATDQSGVLLDTTKVFGDFMDRFACLYYPSGDRVLSLDQTFEDLSNLRDTEIQNLYDALALKGDTWHKPLTCEIGAPKAEVKEPVAQQAPVQQAPVQKAPVQQAPVQQAPVQKAPVQQAPVQKAPVQQAPVQKAPVQQAPVQKAPVQKAPVQQAPADKTTADMKARLDMLSSNEDDFAAFMTQQAEQSASPQTTVNIPVTTDPLAEAAKLVSEMKQHNAADLINFDEDED